MKVKVPSKRNLQSSPRVMKGSGLRSARFAANPILDFRNQKSGQSVKLFWILVSRDQQTAYSCLKIQAVETENK